MTTYSPTSALGFSQSEFRLFLAQQILAQNLNIPLRILRGDSFEQLRAVVSPSDWEVLHEFIQRGGPDDLLSEDLPPKLVDLLSPEDQAAFEQVSMALWKTPASAPHPFYEEIKSLLRRFQARVRLNLLRKAQVLHDSSDDPRTSAPPTLTLDLPAGLLGLLVKLAPEHPSASRKADLLVVGPARLLSEEPGRPGSRFVELERQTGDFVESLERTIPHSLNIEDKTNLLVFSSAYTSYGLSDLHHKSEAARRSLVRLLSIESRHKAILNGLSSAEWTRLVHFFFFWQSPRTLPLLQHFIVSAATPLSRTWFALGKPRTTDFQVSTGLSSARKEGGQTLVRVMGHATSAGAISLEKLSFDVSEAQGALTLQPEQLRIELADGQALPPEAQAQLTYFFHRSIEDSHANRAWQEYLSFDRLRHRLQHLPVDDLANRIRLFTERARELVMADVSAYLEFDSLQDTLVVSSVSPAAWVSKNDQIGLNRWLKEVAADPSKREESAVYRCLDFKSYQSRLLITKESRPFATGLESSIRQIPRDQEFWGIAAEDLIAIPVQFHDRILGVLYLMSGTANRFRYYDRIRLLSYVRMFEAELFEARLFTLLRNMNEDLGSALREDLTQNQLCDRLMFNLGRLLGVSGTILWWHSPTEGDCFEALGYAGAQLTGLISHGQKQLRTAFPSVEASGGKFPVTGSLDDVQPVLGRLRESLPHVLPIPIPDMRQRKIIAFVTLHDSAPIVVSDFLRGELEFIRDELGQNLSSYMEQRKRIQTIRDLIGHDLSSALKYIDSTRRRLESFEDHLPEPRREGYTLRIGDLDRTVRRAQHLLDLLTRESLQWFLLKGEADLFSPYRLLSQSLREQISIHDAVKAHFHTKDLFDRNISFQATGRHPPSLWLDEGAVGRIFANLVDNIVKYGAPSHSVRISYEQDELEYFVHIESMGLPLRRELRGDPGRVFVEGVRGVEEPVLKKTPGSGKGLYLSREIVAVWEGQLILDYSHGEPWSRYTFTLSFPRWLAARANPWR